MPMREPYTREEVVKWSREFLATSGSINDLHQYDLATHILTMNDDLDSHIEDNVILANLVNNQQQKIADFRVEYSLLQQGLRKTAASWKNRLEETKEAYEAKLKRLQNAHDQVIIELRDESLNIEEMPRCSCGSLMCPMGYDWKCYNCGHSQPMSVPDDDPNALDVDDPIREQIIEINDTIKEAQNIKKEIQNICSHGHGNYLYRSNTGGYDGPDYDTYWVSLHCTDCDKRWTAQSENGLDGEQYFEFPRKPGWNKERS